MFVYVVTNQSLNCSVANLCYSAMELGSAGQYASFLENIQQLWYNPQFQQFYKLHATHPNHNVHQPCLGPSDPHPPLPPPFNQPPLSHPPPPLPPACEHPSAALGSHMSHNTWDNMVCRTLHKATTTSHRTGIGRACSNLSRTSSRTPPPLHSLHLP